MKQLTDFSDERLVVGCIYCGAAADTTEHVPSRAFLDTPYPENLHVVRACHSCNNSFSSDEEYVACLVEVVLAGSTRPLNMRRQKIARTLEHSAPLRHRLEAARVEDPTGIAFVPEFDRIHRVMTKLAVGHAAYELAETGLGTPSRLACQPLAEMAPEQRAAFNDPDPISIFPEIGSRAMQRLVLNQFPIDSSEAGSNQFALADWVEVQPVRYRFLAFHDGACVNVRIVLSEFFWLPRLPGTLERP